MVCFWASSSSGIQILAVSPHHCHPGGDLAEAARDGNVEAAEHFVKVSPESINSKDIFGGAPRWVMRSQGPVVGYLVLKYAAVFLGTFNTYTLQAYQHVPLQW